MAVHTGMRERVAVRGAPHLHPRHALSQNFLRDPNTARKIVAAINPADDDVLIEIGPGEGALTVDLARQAGTLVVVDVDERVIKQMSTLLAGTRTEIIHRDILDVDVTALAAERGRVRVVGNIPYNITTPILFHLLEHRAAVRDAVLLMQREVARRLVGKPGTKEYGILTVFCHLVADVDVLFDVAPTVFVPQPRVTSTLVRLTMLPGPRVALADEPFFRALVRAVFGKRRKTLRNSLRYFLPGVSEFPTRIDLQRRPETLSLDELAALANDLQSLTGSRGTAV